MGRVGDGWLQSGMSLSVVGIPGSFPQASPVSFFPVKILFFQTQV